MESTTVLAFRIFVMLSCLIVVPMAAIFGSAFPDVVKSVLVDRLVHWATGQAPEKPPVTAAGFSTVAPAAMVELPAAAPLADEAPRWNQTGNAPTWNSRASYETPAGGAAATSGVAQAGGPVDTSGAHQPAAYAAPSGGPVGSFPVGNGAGNPAELGGFRSAPAATTPAAGVEPDSFSAMERKLRDYGATYYLLETWGNDREMFRFHCKMAIGNNANYTRHFEAVDRNALEAMRQVVTQVENWRTGRVQ